MGNTMKYRPVPRRGGVKGRYKGDEGQMRDRDMKRERRVGHRNGCGFVMSGVEMTVPFVLKFVVF